MSQHILEHAFSTLKQAPASSLCCMVNCLCIQQCTVQKVQSRTWLRTLGLSFSSKGHALQCCKLLQQSFIGFGACLLGRHQCLQACHVLTGHAAEGLQQPASLRTTSLQAGQMGTTRLQLFAKQTACMCANRHFALETVVPGISIHRRCACGMSPIHDFFEQHAEQSHCRATFVQAASLRDADCRAAMTRPPTMKLSLLWPRCFSQPRILMTWSSLVLLTCVPQQGFRSKPSTSIKRQGPCWCNTQS